MAPSLRARYWRILGARPRPVPVPPQPPPEPEKPSEITEYTGWAIVSLYGKQRLAGYVSAEERFGKTWLRIDCIGGVTRYQDPQGSIWSWTPCTEEAARAAASACDDPAPVRAWELPKPKTLLPSVPASSLGRVHSTTDADGDPMTWTDERPF